MVDIYPEIAERCLGGVETTIPPNDQQNKDFDDSKPTDSSRRSSSAPKARFWFPTLVLNLDVKKVLSPPPEASGETDAGVLGVEWLFVRVSAHVIKNGRMDLQIVVLDQPFDPVAISTLAGLIIGTERNLAGREGRSGGDVGQSKL